VIQVKCKRKTQKETNLSGKKDKKKSSTLGWEIGSFLYMIKMKRERGGGGERIKERDREQRKNGVAIGFCFFCSFVC
jgi:hypothetical protein